MTTELSNRPPLNETDQLMTLITGETNAFDNDGISIIKRQYDSVPRFKEAMKADPVGTLMRRVASAVAGSEAPKERLKWAQKYYDMMAGRRFCPGGRILAGAGSEHGNVLNCFVQGATTHDPKTFEGVMELATKLAMVTKVGGGNGVNLDVFNDIRKDAALSAPVAGLATLHASHPDAMTFARSEMTPSNNPEGKKVYVRLRNWNRAIIADIPLSNEMQETCQAFDVQVITPEAYAEMVKTSPHINVPDDLSGIVKAAGDVALSAYTDGTSTVINLSTMRPEGTPIRGSGGTSSGPFSFLAELFENFLTWANLGLHHSGPINTLRYIFAPVLRVVRQGGSRRGAGMATISVHNNHVLDFLTAKDTDREEQEGDISTFNISILADDSFMESVSVGGVLSYSSLIIPENKYDEERLRKEGMEETDTGIILPARFIWNEIADHAWQTGEPGLIFGDRVNHFSAINKMGEKYKIRSTNPCGEIPLTTGEPCDLGAINLAAYIKAPDQIKGEKILSSNGKRAFDMALYRQDIHTAVRFLDDVLDINVFALEDNLTASRDLRRLGLGIMGLADALILMEVSYASFNGRELTSKLMTVLREEATRASEQLGKDRGIYPLMQRELDAAKAEGREPLITHTPRRNVAVLTVAPTGTTSMAFGVSSGIEPIFSPFMWRKIGSEYKALVAPLLQQLLQEHPAPNELSNDQGQWDMEKVKDMLDADGHGTVQGLTLIPAEVRRYFVAAHDISPTDHVLMQGTIQRAFDAGNSQIGNALSKTINLPTEATVSEIREAYRTAYDTGCKGITVYRNGSRGMQVLSTTSKSSEESTLDFSELQSLLQDGSDWVVRITDGVVNAERLDPNMFAQPIPKASRIKRPNVLGMLSYKVTTFNLIKQENQTYLVNVGHEDGRIIEVQVLGGRAGDESNADSEALGRSISIALQHGSETGPFIKTLSNINGGLSGRMNGRAVTSKGDMIAVALQLTQEYLEREAQKNTTFVQSIQDVEESEYTEEAATPRQNVTVIPGASHCKQCNNISMVREEGCHKCQVCGHAMCG